MIEHTLQRTNASIGIRLKMAVDFIRVGIGPLRTGILNVADIAITVGALAFAAGALSGKNKGISTPRMRDSGTTPTRQDAEIVTPYG